MRNGEAEEERVSGLFSSLKVKNSCLAGGREGGTAGDVCMDEGGRVTARVSD